MSTLQRRILRLADVKWVTARAETVEQSHVDDLAAALSESVVLPLPAAMEDSDGVLWGFRGEYTARAYQKRQNEAEFEVSSGSRADALFAAAQENFETDDRRGKKRTRACKLKAITIVLEKFSPERKLTVSIAEVVRLTGTYYALVVEQMGILQISRDEEGVVVRRGQQEYKQRPAVPGFLDALRFVMPAVSTGRDSQYVTLSGNRVTACDGIIAMSAPVVCDLPPCRPLGRDLLEAVRSVGGAPELELRADGRLMVSREGSVRFVECSPAHTDLPSPSGDNVEWPAMALTSLEPWCGPEGVLLRDNTACARLGRACVRSVLERPVPRSVRLPARAVLALSGEKVTRVQLDAKSITFHIGNCWLWSTLMETERSGDDWSALDDEFGRTPVPATFFLALEELGDEGRVHLRDGYLVTTEGATEPVPGLRGDGCFAIEELRRLEDKIKTLDAVGNRLYFTGDNLRGALEGVSAPLPVEDATAGPGSEPWRPPPTPPWEQPPPEFKLYLASAYETGFHEGRAQYEQLTEAERRHRDCVRHHLESFYAVGRSSAVVGQLREEGVRIFLDSGAYTAHTKRVKIDLRDYVDFIKRHRDIIREEDGVLLASVLDVIGDPLETYRNQVAMEYLLGGAVRPVPCHHYGEDGRYLEWYAARYAYVSLGGMVGRSPEELVAWLDPLWERYLLDGAGRPRVMVHGFGLTSAELMRRYAWQSVDSTSWLVTARTGNVFFPDQGTVDSADIPASAELLGLVRGLGFEPERLRSSVYSREAFCCWAYTELGRRVDREHLQASPSSLASTVQPSLF